MFREAIKKMTGYISGEQPAAGAKVIKLNTNENPYRCSSAVALAVQHATAMLGKYPNPTALSFRLAAADVLGIAPDSILCGNGSDELLTILMRTFVGEGEHIRFPNPSYILYKTLADIQGAECHVVNFNPDWSVSEDFLKPCKHLRLVFLANPNSPSGTILPPEKVAKLAGALPCPLVVDEAYADFATSNCLKLVAKHENIIVTRTLSKSYSLAGLRFGFLVAQPKIIEQLLKVKDSYNCDTLSIAAATAAIADQKWLADTRAKLLKTRKRLADKLTQFGFVATPSEANFVWITHNDRPLKPIYEALKQQGILVRYLNYPRWGDGLRITVGTDSQIDAFLVMMEETLSNSDV